MLSHLIDPMSSEAQVVKTAWALESDDLDLNQVLLLKSYPVLCSYLILGDLVFLTYKMGL